MNVNPESVLQHVEKLAELLNVTGGRVFDPTLSAASPTRLPAVLHMPSRANAARKRAVLSPFGAPMSTMGGVATPTTALVTLRALI